MTDQEIIDAIDAEIAEEESILSEYMDSGCEPTALAAYHKGGIAKLRFARDLIAKRMEGGK